MTVDCVLDTNILLYAVSKNLKHHSKKQKAIKLIESEAFGTSAQIMQEFYANATRKTDFAMTPDEALQWIEGLENLPCWPTDLAHVKNAVLMSQRYRISYWDGAVIAASEALGAGILYTEDLNHGQTYGSVEVVNPFLETPPPGLHERAEAPFRP